MNHHQKPVADEYTVVVLRPFSAPATVFVNAESVEQAQELACTAVSGILRAANDLRIVFVAVGHHRNVAVY